MRIAIVRSDISKVYLDDVENSSQRNFSSETSGQSRYFHKPTDLQISAVLTAFGVATSNTAAVKTAAYPTSTTVDVSAATLGAVSGVTALATGPKAACVAALADLIAPKLVETGPVLLSFVKGKLSKLASASFRPGGARGIVPAGAAAAIVQNDGSTQYVI